MAKRESEPFEFGNDPDSPIDGSSTPSDDNYPEFDPKELAITENLPAVALADVLETLGLGGPEIPADDLRGKTFTIKSARTFPSQFHNQKYAYFCRCLDSDDKPFTTVLGGTAVIDTIDGLIAMGWHQPLIVTLEWKTGGNYRGYYVLK